MVSVEDDPEAGFELHVALAPDGVSVTDRRDGLLEIQLGDTSWLESAATASPSAA